MTFRAIIDIPDQHDYIGPRFSIMAGWNSILGLFKGGIPMLEVTEAATTQVAEYFKGQDPTPIRIFLNQGG